MNDVIPSAESIDRLRRATEEHGLVVYAGAGLSRSAGLPSWDELLQDLFDRAVGRSADQATADAAREQLRRLPDGKLQPLVLGRLLKDQLGLKLRETVRDSLLAKIAPARAPGGPLPTVADLMPRLDTPLFDAVATLVGAAATRGVLRGIVTYNYNDLLETALERKGLASTPVLSPLRAAGLGVVPVYHVHGYLPLTREAAERRLGEQDVVRAARLPEPGRHVFRCLAFQGRTPAEVADLYGRPEAWVDDVYGKAVDSMAAGADPNEVEVEDNFVLSEDEYHQEYAEPFRWSNVVQTSLLRCHTAIFIGISLTDPNHRRLIDLTRRAGSVAPRVAILSQSDLRDASRSPLHELTSVVRRMDRLTLEKLGVEAIQVEGHNAVPSVVNALAGAFR